MLNHAFSAAQVLAQAAGESSERGYSISWAIIMFSVILGIYVAVRPAKRADEVKKPKPS